MTDAPELSVVIPAYNEEEALGPALDRVRAWLEEQPFTWEVVVVDDGSGDGTSRILQEAADGDPRIRACFHNLNQGKSRALRTGVLASRGKRVLVTDADLSAPISELPRLWEKLEAGCDVAFGSRSVPGTSSVERPQALHRVLLGRAFNLLVQLLLLPGCWDTQCGFKLFRGDLARDLFARSRIDSWSFDVEILFLARFRGARLAEVPVRWINRPSSRVRALLDPPRMFLDLLLIRLNAMLGRYR